MNEEKEGKKRSGSNVALAKEKEKKDTKVNENKSKPVNTKTVEQKKESNMEISKKL